MCCLKSSQRDLPSMSFTSAASWFLSQNYSEQHHIIYSSTKGLNHAEGQRAPSEPSPTFFSTSVIFLNHICRQGLGAKRCSQALDRWTDSKVLTLESVVLSRCKLSICNQKHSAGFQGGRSVRWLNQGKALSRVKKQKKTKTLEK